MTTSKPVLIIIALVAILIIGGVWDTVSNWGKAYGNVVVNGVSVAGMNEEEIKKELLTTFSPRVAHAQVTIYADEEAKERGRRTLDELQAAAIAEQVDADDESLKSSWWQADALTLKAKMPYDEVARQAIAVGREDGGIGERLALLFSERAIDFNVEFDDAALESLASEIDQSVGDERRDASVRIEDGVAYAEEGHDGTILDRQWFAQRISDAMIKDSVPDSFVAEVSEAPSRITFEQATELRDRLNRMLKTEVVFKYEAKQWSADGSLIGSWTDISLVETDDGYALQPRINDDAALDAIIKGTGAVLTSQGTTVNFEKSFDDIMVHTSGSGDMPEVSSAISVLNDTLYGEEGLVNSDQVPEMFVVEIGKKPIPEEVPFEEALASGIITNIGEYTTEFSNSEGTENRNHNIKLAADILNDGIVKANGGIWDFNTESGDTNEEAGFWSAGSIVDGEYVDSIGGGICQVATTIFNAVYEGGLEVVTRRNHTLYIASYPTGRDAAVSYPDLDFTWKNPLSSDVLLKLSYTDSSITAKLYSVYTGYYAETEVGAWEDGEKYSTRFEKDESIGDGMYYLKTIGEDGSKIAVTRTVYNDKDQVVRNDYFQSVYEPKDEVYVIGSNVDTSALTRKQVPDSTSTSSYGDDAYQDYSTTYGTDYSYDSTSYQDGGYGDYGYY